MCGCVSCVLNCRKNEVTVPVTTIKEEERGMKILKSWQS